MDASKDKGVEFLQVSSYQLITSVHGEAMAWVHAIGQAMATQEKHRVINLHAKIDKYAKTLGEVS